MEHGDVPLHTGRKAAKPQTALTPAETDSPAPTDAAADSTAQTSDQPTSDTADVTPAQDASTQPIEGRDPRAQLVKESMEAASRDVPDYLRRVERSSKQWSLESSQQASKDEKTDQNIITAWLKSLVKDPFWVRTSPDAKDDDPEDDVAEPAKDDKATARAEQDLEQQMLQESVQAQQRDRCGLPCSLDYVPPGQFLTLADAC